MEEDGGPMQDLSVLWATHGGIGERLSERKCSNIFGPEAVDASLEP